MQLLTRNKNNDYFESLQYRQDVRHIAHYHKRKHFPSYTRCTENRNNTCAEKHRRYPLFNKATASLVTVKRRTVTNINK